MGFVNINWRKGTGLDSSPADSGRDLECNKRCTEVDGSEYYEKWFVECKHHKRGVPPREVQNALSWAQAERPDVLCIVASNFLSNPAKDQLTTYREKNKPAFKIFTWERDTLEVLCANKPALCRKYDLPGGLHFLSSMHPAHLRYVAKPQMNSLDYFLQLLEDLEPTKRDEIMGDTVLSLLSASVPVTENAA